MNFGQAIELVKSGQRVARAGWNGKGMFVFLQKGKVGAVAYNGTNYLTGEKVERLIVNGERTVEIFKSEDPNADNLMNAIGGVNRNLFDFELREKVEQIGDVQTAMPSLVMKTADGSHVVGWLASQTDILAEDWEVAQ